MAILFPNHCRALCLDFICQQDSLEMSTPSFQTLLSSIKTMYITEYPGAPIKPCEKLVKQYKREYQSFFLIFIFMFFSLVLAMSIEIELLMFN